MCIHCKKNIIRDRIGFIWRNVCFILVRKKNHLFQSDSIHPQWELPKNVLRTSSEFYCPKPRNRHKSALKWNPNMVELIVFFSFKRTKHVTRNLSNGIYKLICLGWSKILIKFWRINRVGHECLRNELLGQWIKNTIIY